MNYHSATFTENNIGTFIRAYNQAQSHKALAFPFEGNEFPIQLARFIIAQMVGDGFIYGCFDDNKEFHRTVNPQLN